MTTKTKFMIEGSFVSVVKMNEETTLDVLPARIYTVKYSDMRGFYLSIVKDQLQVPAKIYGQTFNKVNKCITSYTSRDTSTGVLLTGDKGSGKSLMMSLLANAIITDLNLPVILIKEAYAGEQFASFIESIGECCLVFDEFGKMYTNNSHSDNVNQDALLSLMDGIDKTKRMIILTENSILDISEFMLNRPSRIYYHFKYSKMDEESINDYCIDYNVPISITQDIIELSRLTRIFSFDMLQSIVEEYLRFESPLNEIIEDLNIDTREEISIKIEILKIIDKSNKAELPIIGNPLVNKPTGKYDYTYIKVNQSNNSEYELVTPEDDEDSNSISFSDDDLVYDTIGKLVYETPNHTIIAKEIVADGINYSGLF